MHPALKIACPCCKVEPGKWCVAPSTGRRYTQEGKAVLHRVRRLAAEEEQEA